MCKDKRKDNDKDKKMNKDKEMKKNKYEIVVNNRKELEKAISLSYRIIEIEGPLRRKILEEQEKQEMIKTGINYLSWVTLIATFPVSFTTTSILWGLFGRTTIKFCAQKAIVTVLIVVLGEIIKEAIDEGYDIEVSDKVIRLKRK